MLASKLIRDDGRRERFQWCLGPAVFSLFHFPGLRVILGRVAAIDRLGAQLAASGGLALLVALACFALASVKGSRTIFWAMAVVMFLVPFVPLTGHLVANLRRRDSFFDSSESRNEIVENGPASRTLPNIYFVIFDMYGSAEQLRRVLGFDDSAFVNALRKRNFYVAEQSQANFPLTYLSIASTLDMDYAAPEGDAVLQGRRGFYRKLKGDNSLVRTVRALGYRYLHVDNGEWSGSACDGIHEDICFQSHSGLTEVDAGLLDMTPLKRLIAALAPNLYSKFIVSRTEPVDIEGILPATGSGPFFMFAHTLATHPPYVLNEDCSKRIPEFDNPDDNELEKKLYLNQLKCINGSAIHLIDAIVARDPRAIIVLQGDHGTAFSKQFTTPLFEWTKAQRAERFGVLNALRVPEACQNRLYPSITLINTFRVILPCITGIPSNLLPDYSYLATYEGQPDYGKVIRAHAS